ncbi:MAG: PD-(D/E)XK nuclease domain-containing protein, partial [Methanobrevibacter sp.]|nr:PD-(D/E)XK nuclease domain-containing protein [Candidatus Methanovirga australis]
FEILLHKIPNILYGDIKKELEAYYKILLMSWIQLLGFQIDSEIQTIKGRLDAVLKHENLVLIIEFKFSLKDDLDKMINNAFSQIIKNEYYKPYQNKKVILLAVAFKSRDIKCELKTLEECLNE